MATVIAGLEGWQLILFFAFVFLFLMAGAIITFVILSKRRWPFSVVVLENVAGKDLVVSLRDKARLVSFGDGGEEIFLLKRAKKYRVGYGKRIGHKQIAFVIAEDGYWYNIKFPDFNKKLLELGVMPVNNEVRLVNASIRKGISDTYKQKNFLEKYGVFIAIGMIIIAILVQGVSTYITNKQNLKISENNAKASETSVKVLESVDRILGKVDTIQSGGTGLVPA